MDINKRSFLIEYTYAMLRYSCMDCCQVLCIMCIMQRYFDNAKILDSYISKKSIWLDAHIFHLF